IAIEVVGLHDVVRNVAAPAAGDEDLRADAGRTIEGDDARAAPAGEDGRHEASRTGADDGDVKRLLQHHHAVPAKATVTSHLCFNIRDSLPTIYHSRP